MQVVLDGRQVCTNSSVVVTAWGGDLPELNLAESHLRTTGDGSDIPNNHRLDVSQTLKMMGKFTCINWLAGFLNHPQ